MARSIGLIKDPLGELSVEFEKEEIGEPPVLGEK